MSSNQQIIESMSRVIFITEILKQQYNYDNRKQPVSVKQSSFDFDDNNENKPDLRMTDTEYDEITTTTLIEDFNDLSKTVKDLCSLLEHVCKSLSISFPNLDYRLSLIMTIRPAENFDNIYSKIHSLAFSNSLTDELVAKVRQKGIEIFTEINELIDKINTSINDGNFNTVILSKDKLSYRNPIIFSDDSSAEFIKAIYKKKEKLDYKSLTFHLGDKVIR